MINKKVGILSLLFLLLYTAGLGGLFIELFTYKGFLFKHLYADPQQLIDLLIIISAILVLLVRKQFYFIRSDIGSILVSILKRIIVLLLIIFVILTVLEGVNYDNYIYSTFHVNYRSLPDLIIRLFFPLILLAVYELRSISEKNYLVHMSTYTRIIIGLFSIIIASYLINNFRESYPYVRDNTIKVLVQIDDSYDEKMYSAWGYFYDYMNFVMQNTEENSIIVIPPMQTPWEREGNGAIGKFFLYPRRLISGTLFGLAESQKYDYIMIASGSLFADEYNKGWPKINVKAKEIILFDIYTKEVTVYPGDYVVNDEMRDSWGLIKIKD